MLPSGICPDRQHPRYPCLPSRASRPVACSPSRAPASAGLAPRPPVLVAGGRFHRWPFGTGRHPDHSQPTPQSRASDALPFSSTRRLTLLLVRPFAPYWQLPWPLLTSRSGSAPSPFQAQGEISPGKNALLHRTTAGFTPLHLGHESFMASCPLALLGSAFYPVLVHRLAASLHASSPHSVSLCSCASLRSP